MAGKPTTDPANPFVDELDAEITRRGWSRARLLDRGGIDSGQMSRIINRQAPLTFEVAVRLAQALEMSPIHVLLWSQLIDPTDTEAAKRAVADELVAILDELSYEGQALLLGSARGIRDASRRVEGRGDEQRRRRQKATAAGG